MIVPYRDWDWVQRLGAGIALAVRQRMPCKLSVTCAKDELGVARFGCAADGASSTCQTTLELAIDFVPDPRIWINAHSADAAPRSTLRASPFFFLFVAQSSVADGFNKWHHTSATRMHTPLVPAAPSFPVWAYARGEFNSAHISRMVS
jgi:hypothetical protein